MNGERACVTCGNLRSEHKAGELDCPGWAPGERVGGLRAKLATLGARATWKVTCLRCGIATTGPSAPWSLRDFTDGARAPPEWGTVRVCHQWDMQVGAESAAMALVRWDGEIAPDRKGAWGEPIESVQRVTLETDVFGWPKLEKPAGDPVPF
jgi:hypothetical protein